MTQPIGEGAAAGTAQRPVELRLVSAEPPPETAQKARRVKLRPDDSVEAAAVAVFSAALDHFEANLPAFRAQQLPESVHQMRVALRRLRAALGLFGPALAGPALETAGARAKTLAATLGAARDWDVFHDMVTQGPGPTLRENPGFYALLDGIELRRAQAYRAARAAIDSPAARAFVADLRAAIASRDWVAADAAMEAGSATPFAVDALTKRRKRALRKFKGLDTRSPEERHDARIALKKARYGAEFFESLFGREGDAAAFSVALARMQDGLGAFNDMETANALLDEIDAKGGASLQASGFVRGWFAHAAQDAAAHARKSEKSLKKLKAFWN